MILIDALKQPCDTEKQTFILHVFAYSCLQLRQSVSIFCRIVNITLQDIRELQQHCSNLLRARCLFSKVSPTFWTMGHIIPAHAFDVFQKYQMGLNVVSMEGREAKHMAIRRYCQNTNHLYRWVQVFRYEFIQLIWLRERGYNVEERHCHKQTYIPLNVTNGESCFCGFERGPQEEKCCYCSHKYRSQIEESVKLGKITVDSNILK